MNADDQQNKMHPILIKFQNFAKKLFHPGISDQYLGKIFPNPIGVRTWLSYLKKDVFMKEIYSFISNILQENKLKMFRWKLLQFISNKK
jgi:hypothetical protein